MPAILALDHVQLAMPAGREEEARAFYVAVLGFTEQPKPSQLAARGGIWLEGGAAHLHLGVEHPFVSARKAHPALLVDDLAAFRDALARAGHAVVADPGLDGIERCYVDDPFGNRLELMQRIGASRPREA